jgi:hypothetical protein
MGESKQEPAQTKIRNVTTPSTTNQQVLQQSLNLISSHHCSN